MADLNTVAITGRLVADAELRYTNSGLSVVNFTVAVNRRSKKGEEWVDEASFIDATMFGKRAESVSRFLTKGQQVGISGELKQDKWEKDGQKRSKVGVIAHDVQLMGGKKQDEFVSDVPF